MLHSPGRQAALRDEVLLEGILQDLIRPSWDQRRWRTRAHPAQHAQQVAKSRRSAGMHTHGTTLKVSINQLLVDVIRLEPTPFEPATEAADGNERRDGIIPSVKLLDVPHGNTVDVGAERPALQLLQDAAAANQSRCAHRSSNVVKNPRQRTPHYAECTNHRMLKFKGKGAPL